MGSGFVTCWDAIRAGAEPAPYGSKDFYPSAKRPIGYYGNGTGYYPGATPVSEFWDGDWVKDPRHTGRTVVMINEQGENIVWKTKMPGWSGSSPVVVGDRVFVTCDPVMLVCADANTGKILWERDVNPFECMGQTGEMARARGEILEMARSFYHMTVYFGSKSGADRVKAAKEVVIPHWKEWLVLVEKTEPELTNSLQNAIKYFTDNPATPMHKGNVPGHVNFSAAVAKKYRIPTQMYWEHYYGFTYATPVSDGEFVYVTMSQGQAACYDLNGKVVWRKFFPQDTMDVSCHDCPSPLLSGDVLIVVFYDTFRGLDKKTGNVLWEKKLKRRLDPQGPGTYTVLDLPKGDGTDPVVVTTYGTTHRVKDGAELIDLGYRMAWEGGSMSILGEKNYAILQPGGQGHAGEDVAALFMKWNGDKLEVEKVFMKGMQVRGRTPTLCDGMLWDAATLWDVKTGNRICSGEQAGREHYWHFFDWPSTIFAGAYGFTATGGRSWQFNRDNGIGCVSISVHKLNGREPAKLASMPNPLGTANHAKSRYLDKYAPEFTAPGKEWCGGDFGVIDRFGYAHFTALGNRLFFRSTIHLYCIGDPKVAYDWNPASRPEQIAKTLVK